MNTTETGLPPDVPRPRILIVDDNEDAATSLRRLLELSGKEVQIAHEGQQALAMIERFQPQVVLLDLGMPGMDGIEIGRQVRARHDWDGVALVALTGWGQEQDRQRTEAAGFAAHLVKPVGLEQLESLLDRLVPGVKLRGAPAPGL